MSVGIEGTQGAGQQAAPVQQVVDDQVKQTETQATEEEIASALFAEPDKKEDEGAEETSQAPEKVEGAEDDEFSAVHESMVAEKEIPFEGEVEGIKLRLPSDVKPDSPMLKKFIETMKKHGAKPGMAQEMVDMVSGYQKVLLDTFMKRDKDFRADMNNQFIRNNKSDPVYGGANYEKNVNYAMKALRTFVPKEKLLATLKKDGYMGMLEYLQASNSMNATPMWQFMVEVGKHISESSPVIPGTQNTTPKKVSAEDSLFASIK